MLAWQKCTGMGLSQGRCFMLGQMRPSGSQGYKYKYARPADAHMDRSGNGGLV